MFYLEIEQSNQNQHVTRIENEYCEFFRNEISMEPLVKASKENPSLQTFVKFNSWKDASQSWEIAYSKNLLETL